MLFIYIKQQLSIPAYNSTTIDHKLSLNIQEWKENRNSACLNNGNDFKRVTWFEHKKVIIDKVAAPVFGEKPLN